MLAWNLLQEFVAFSPDMFQLSPAVNSPNTDRRGAVFLGTDSQRPSSANICQTLSCPLTAVVMVTSYDKAAQHPVMTFTIKHVEKKREVQFNDEMKVPY